MKRITLNLLLCAGVFSATLLAASGWQPSTALAQSGSKQVPGKSIATQDGTLVCDCTKADTTCKCIVDGGGDIAPLME